jgi:hypothetical protein
VKTVPMQHASQIFTSPRLHDNRLRSAPGPHKFFRVVLADPLRSNRAESNALVSILDGSLMIISPLS